MSVGTLSASTPQVTFTPPAHHGHRSHSAGTSSTSSASGTSAGPSEADESIEQLAEQGDPIAIAELKAETPRPAGTDRAAAPQASPQAGGAKEPGKGEQVDTYA